MRGDPDATRDFIYVGDVCEIFRRSLAWRGRNEAYNLGSGENVSVRTLAENVLRLAGAARPIVSRGTATSVVAHRRCRNDRLKADFDFHAFTPLVEGLKSTIALVSPCPLRMNLIIGGGGFVGTNLRRCFTKRGLPFAAIMRADGDLRDRDTVMRLF